ncbi:MAG TPA: RluA family pseudouridine synthase [Cyclobacteriaceae bacterium]|nr:RluA family pseudouridine synthase [Cyclobacteriaceae bacterium]
MLDSGDILYEDNHLLIVNKPAGVLAQGDKTGDVDLTELARNYLKKKYSKPGNVFVGLPHRIDRPVSGALILCKTSKSLSRVSELFNKKKISKVYWAIVKNKPHDKKGKLIHWLIKDRELNKVRAYIRETENAQRAELDYETIQVSGNYCLLEVHPLTGRPHQIRVQLAEINIPIAGDVKYGGESIGDNNRINLHARSVEFLHPVKNEIVKIVAPLPETGLWKLFKRFENIYQ